MQPVEGEAHQGALPAQRREIAVGHGGQGLQAVQPVLHFRRVTLVNDGDAAALVTEAAENGVGQSHLFPQPGRFVPRLGGQDEKDPCRPVARRAEQEVEPDLRHLGDGERQNVGGKPASAPRHDVDHPLAEIGVVYQENRVLAPRLPVSGEQGA